MNPHASQSLSLLSFARTIAGNYHLIVQMARREVVGRYKGSIMGIGWSFFNPILMLTVYTFVFSEIFRARWPGGSESKTQFALLLFVGMIVLSLFSEVLNRSPNIIVSNVNFVKKVIFPVEILPVVAIITALFHSIVSIGVLLIALLVLNGQIHPTMAYLPVILIPLLIFTAGLSWTLASLGVFIRDVGQTTTIITTIMTFLSPVFYPVTAVPERFRPWIMANPLTFIIEQAREVTIWGNSPDWNGLAIYTAGSVAVAWAGFAWFQKTRKGFADVL